MYTGQSIESVMGQEASHVVGKPGALMNAVSAALGVSLTETVITPRQGSMYAGMPIRKAFGNRAEVVAAKAGTRLMEALDGAAIKVEVVKEASPKKPSAPKSGR